MFIRLTPMISVASQIAPEDCALAKSQGFVAIVNNRPDGEAAGQPDCAAMRAGAQAAGLRYADIPIDHSGFAMPQVEAMAEVLRAGGPVLAFCRSGTRSTNLWALAAASMGEDPDAIVAAAAGGGYDVSGMLPSLRMLAAKA
ncbi:MAG: TIGR01244 family phosphatase [Sandarakinorhabdus sp.]|nr:TIGR01244 family phosphatase [Sandarakinorhabdus sp.]